jgi:hypothetical protein
MEKWESVYKGIKEKYNKEVLNLKETAEVLGCDPRTVRKIVTPINDRFFPVIALAVALTTGEKLGKGCGYGIRK